MNPVRGEAPARFRQPYQRINEAVSNLATFRIGRGPGRELTKIPWPFSARSYLAKPIFMVRVLAGARIPGRIGLSAVIEDKLRMRHFRHKPFFRIGTYRRGVAAYVANRSAVPFVQCLDIVEWNWPILVDAFDAGERFQQAGARILTAMLGQPTADGQRRPARHSQGGTKAPRQRPRPARRAASSAAT
ncbi:MAG TPA: hypothetical protein VGA60_06285 [Kiloniellales bacterium]|jgi:hypothetical protein